MDETMQINSCIEEIAKLKAKMEELEKQKNLNEIIKKTTMEPNLKVLENWLIDYRKAIKDENNGVTKQMINIKKNYIRSEINHIIQGKNKRKYQKINFKETLETLDNDSYKTLLKKEMLVNNSSNCHNIMDMLNYDKISFITFDEKLEPSEVMEAHIEATYNMFNIINKRLDCIEKKIGIHKKIEP